MNKRLISLIAIVFAAFMFITACTDSGDIGSSDSASVGYDSAESNIEDSSFDESDSENSSADDSISAYVTVTFDSNGGTEVQPITVKRGETIICPDTVFLKSTLENPVVFDGWYLGNKKWDFKSGVNEDMTLVAHWKQDGRYTEPIIPEK